MTPTGQYCHVLFELCSIVRVGSYTKCDNDNDDDDDVNSYDNNRSNNDNDNNTIILI